MGDTEDVWNDERYRKELKQLKELKAETTGWYDDINGISIKARKDQLQFINDEIKRYKNLEKEGGKIGKQAAELLALTIKQRDTYEDQFRVVGRIQNEVNKTYRDFTNFMSTYASQYEYAQKIAKEYLSVSRDIGATAGMGDRLTRTFKDSLAEVEQMGGSMEDVTNIMNTMAEESGRVKILDREAVTTIEAIAKGTNMMASDASKMAETFDLMGVSTDQMGEHLAEVFKSSQAIGLNANKVIKTLATNMDAIQSYSFASGVKGMTEMAKQAVKMRIDVSDVLQMADKFYQPEAAIEAAANLQMLGGDIADAFGDPFETMYLARNKPEELAKRLGDMTENMMQFNSETGEYEFPAEVRMQLKAAGEQLGINTEKMVEMARQSSKIKDLKMKFTAIGDNDMKENLSSLAKWSEEKGEFVIKHEGDELGLDEINEGLADEIVNASKNENKTDSDLFKNIAINTQTMSEQLVSMKEASMATIAGTTDLYEITAEQMKENLLTPMKKNMDIMTTKFTESFNPESLFDEVEWDTTFGGAADEVRKFTDALAVAAIDILKKKPDKEDKTSGKGKHDDFLMRDDGSTIVDFHEEDDIMGAKTGGPLDKLMDRAIPAASNTVSSPVSGSIDVNFNNAVITLKSSSGEVAMDMNKIKDAIQPIIINAINNKSRNGGVLSSKEAVDNGLTV